MEIVQRILDLVNEKAKSIRDFALLIGVPERTISTYLKTGRTPSLEAIDAILRTFPEVSAEWLLRGEGSMFIEQASPASNVIPAGMTGVYDAVIKGKDERIKELETEVNQLIGENNIMREQLGIGERRASEECVIIDLKTKKRIR